MQNRKLNLVLDLDQTLISSANYTLNQETKYCNFELYLTSFFLGCHKYVVYKRPYLFEFLEYVSKIFNVYVYTAASLEYALPIINAIHLKLNKQLFIEVYSSNGQNKYLASIGLNKLNTIIIDDQPDYWPHDIDNLFTIKPFTYYQFNSRLDDELKIYGNILESILENYKKSFFGLFAFYDVQKCIKEREQMSCFESEFDFGIISCIYIYVN